MKLPTPFLTAAAAAPSSTTSSTRNFPPQSDPSPAFTSEPHRLAYIQIRILRKRRFPHLLVITLHFRKEVHRRFHLVRYGIFYWFKLQTILIEVVAEGKVDRIQRTFRLTPRTFFSPSSFLSNLPMLAVLIRAAASVFSISCFFSCRGLLPAARAMFCVCCFKFFAMRSFLASLAIFRGS